MTQISQQTDAGTADTLAGGGTPGLSVHGILRGIRDLAGAIPAVAAFGLGFGAAAMTAGLSPAAAIAMSAFVFAGASQFAALGLWQGPIPLVALVILTLTINARHLVLGATLHSYLGAHAPVRRYASVALLTDSNWASTQKARQAGERDLGHLVGGGLLVWTAWVAGTSAGAFFGTAIGNLDRFGVDVVMPAFFACALIDFVKARKHLPPIAIAAVVSVAVSLIVGMQWAVLLGTVAGGALGAALDAD